MEKKIVRDFGLSKFIYCSDAGLGSLSNKKFNSISNRAYIITQSIKKLKEKDKEVALDLSRFKPLTDELYYQELPLDGKIQERMIITYSPKYAIYQKNIRAAQIQRAENMIHEDGKIKKQRRNPNDPARFIETIISNQNGEVVEKNYILNEEKIQEESKYDGFYAITTNLEDDDVSKIISISERRWQIEECFRIMKTDFKARPVYLQLEDRINAHFLICFCALLITRLLSIKLKNKFTVHEILSTIRTMTLTDTGYGSYIPSYKRTALTDELHEIFGFRTDYEISSKQSIRNIIKNTK